MVDALVSGISNRKVVEVQILFWAPFKNVRTPKLLILNSYFVI